MIRRLGLNLLGRGVGNIWQRRLIVTMRSYGSDSSMPRIASASLWSSLVPKPFRKTTKDNLRPGTTPKPREWNPATFFIVVSLLIGSNAIQLVSLKTHRLNYNQSTDAKLSLLREVISRVKNGEDVNVEAMLGKGDPEREKEWEEVMKDLEREDDIWAKKQVKKESENPATGTVPSTSNITSSAAQTTSASEATAKTVERKPGFY